MITALSADEGVRESFATDASGLRLVPDCVARPSTEPEVLEVLAHAAGERTGLTAAGGQTSTTGASITDRGILLSLRGLDRILDVDPVQRSARVQPGVHVAELGRAAAEAGLMLGPDPTSEEDCTVGGAVACNASGARTLLYGPTRQHVRALRVALAGGEVLELRRTRLEKNTAGYAIAHDPVDWFVGSEGTLGIVLEVELGLLPKPERIVGLGLPFATEQEALAFVAAARAAPHLRPRCLEFFDATAAAIFRGDGPQASRPPLVYLEEALGPGEEPAFEAWLALAEAHDVQDGDIEVYDDAASLRAARRRRHLVPATMDELGNRCRPAGGRRISTDWAVPYARLGDTLAMARALADERGIAQAVTFGHAGNGHPHQNFVCHDADELRRTEAVVEETLRRVVAAGGTVSAEHGIGKLKRKWLGLQVTPLQLAAMRALKHELDPLGILAPGNIF